MRKADYYPCRCTSRKCRARITLRKHPDAYVRPRRCPVCGGPLTLDAHRYSRKDSVFDTCYCAAAAGRDGQNRPHRKGSMVMCEHFKVPF